MKLGFFLNAYRFFDLDYALKSVKEHGYQGVELWGKGYHMTPFDNPDTWRAIAQKITGEYGLEIYGISAHLDFVAPGPSKREFEIKKFLGVLDMASTMGVTKVHTASGGLFTEISYEEQEKHFIDAMNRIGKVASQRGITVALEAEPEKWLSRPEQVVDLIENKLDHDCFGAVIDTGHAFGIGTTVEEYLECLKNHLTVIHLDDVRKTDFPHFHLVPGEGDVNFESAFATLQKLGYDGWISMELNRSNEDPDGAARKAKAYMDNMDITFESTAAEKAPELV